MLSTKSALELIQILNQSDEAEDLEAKAASDEKLGRSVLETICALANEPDLHGGTILLGVTREEALFPIYAPTGVSDPDKLMSDISSACNSIFNIPIRVSMKIEKVGTANILRVDVKELQAHQKPAYFSSTGLPRGAYRRVGPTDVRCTEEDLLVFFQGKDNASFDSHIVDGATMEDIDPVAIAAYRKARSDSNPLAEELNWDDEEILYAVGGVRKVDGRSRVTTTGVLVFGKTASIRRLFPTHRVDYIRVPGKTWVSDVEKRFDSVDMRGPIITLVGRIIATISDDLPSAFRLPDDHSGQRLDMPLLPARVIREVVVNALMHRSYQVFQPIQIIRYANRLVINNPGYSLKAEERFDDPGSVSRNPHIAEILHDTRFAENKGSGIRVMRQQLQQSGLTLPTFTSDRTADLFSASFLFHHFLNEDDWKWLAAFKRFDLTSDQQRALVFVRETGSIDNSIYRSLTQTDTLTASKSLRRLRSAEVLTSRGVGAKTFYEPGPAFLAAVAMEPPPVTMEPNSHVMGVPAQTQTVAAKDLPLQLRRAVTKAALTARMNPREMRALISQLCSWRALSAAEIGRLIQKAPTYLSQTFLNPMVSEGALEFVHNEPNHPEQRYRTATAPTRPA